MIDKSLWPLVEDAITGEKKVPRYEDTTIPRFPSLSDRMYADLNQCLKMADLKMNEGIKAKSIPFKYREAEIVKELHDYLASTYSGHYVGEDNIQSVDLIFASGHGEGFSIGNIIKYASRQGKKKGQERADILKILHYAVFLLYLYDKKDAQFLKKQGVNKLTDGSENKSG